MITIEGLGGKGTLWCTFPVPRGHLTKPSYDEVGYNIVSYRECRVIPISPFECRLPPVDDASVWYDVAASQYGPRLARIDIGTLDGVTNSPNTPNPCSQSTLRGALTKLDTDPAKRLRFLAPAYDLPVEGEWFLNARGEKLSFISGQSMSLYAPWAGYNRYGDKVWPDLTMQNIDQWSTTHFLFTDCAGQQDPLSPTYVNPARYGDIMFSSALDENFMQQNNLARVNCTHVSARVWETEVIDEIHHNASYTPSSSVSKETGYGFLVSSLKRERTYTMTHIQSTRPTIFRARFSVSEKLSWYGWDFPLGPFEGSKITQYTIETSILVMFPGKSIGGSFDKTLADAYCASAISRAMDLYRCKDATIARSKAVADVQGLESNWLENLSQVGGTTAVLIPLLKGWKAFKHGDLNEARHALAGAYLSYKYVIAPGISDYKDVKENLGDIYRGFTKHRFSNERRRGTYRLDMSVLETIAQLTHSCTLNLKLKDNPMASIFNALEKLGLDPAAGNLWDLIPFSFVADWFVPIGPVLSQADALHNNEVLRDVTNRIESFKVQWPLSDIEINNVGMSEYSVISPISYVWYDRRVLTGLGSFDPFAGQTIDGLSVSQMAQGTALLSSYKK